MRSNRCRVCRWLAAIALTVPALAVAAPPTLFAAASLQPALEQMAHAGLLGTPAPLRVYAGSAALARQIENGAPADIFISADQRWMDAAAHHGNIVAASRVNLLGNALVVIAPAAAQASLKLDHAAAPWLAALGADGRLAIALPDSVPAGMYAKQALTRLGLWQALEPRMAMARDVRAALNLVVLGQCPLGIVYRSDAVSEPRVQVLASFPAATHAAIVYPAAIVSGRDKPATRAVMAAMQSPPARAAFARWGFTAPPPQSIPSATNREKRP